MPTELDITVQAREGQHERAMTVDDGTPCGNGSRWGRRAKTAPTMVSHAELRRMLGGPQSSPDGCPDMYAAEVPMWRMRLGAGDLLYAEGDAPAYGYIVESGVIQCVRRRDDDAPDAVSHVAAHGLIGIERLPHRRHETALAITDTSLLAMPMASLHEVDAISPILRELLARPQGQGLMRDWRLVYRLRDLPPHPRTLAALCYIVDMMQRSTDMAQTGASVNVAIDISHFRRWLALSHEELGTCLNQLHRIGAIQCSEGVIHALSPEVLVRMQSAMPAWCRVHQNASNTSDTV